MSRGDSQRERSLMTRHHGKEMKMLECNTCGEPFFDYQGYEERDDGVVCSYCLDEEDLLNDEDEEKK